MQSNVIHCHWLFITFMWCVMTYKCLNSCLCFWTKLKHYSSSLTRYMSGINATQRLLPSVWNNLLTFTYLGVLLVRSPISSQTSSQTGIAAGSFSIFIRAMIKTSVSAVLTTILSETTRFSTWKSIFFFSFCLLFSFFYTKEKADIFAIYT